MQGRIVSSILAVVLCLIERSSADTAQYFYSHQLDTCYWGSYSLEADNNTAHGGVCAYVQSTGRLYACPAPDATCWSFAQNCANGQNPGPGQIYCSNTVYDENWCCQEHETCTPNAEQYNVCISQFPSPNKGVSPENAEEAEYSVVPSSVIGTDAPARATPSVFSTAVFAGDDDNTSATASSSSSPTSSASASNTRTSSQAKSSTGTATASAAHSTSSSSSDDAHSHISTAAIVGIVVGVLGGLAIICGTIIFLFLHRRRAAQPNDKNGTGSGTGAGAVTYTSKQNEKTSYVDETYYQPSSPYSDNDNTYKGGYMQAQPLNYLVEAPSTSQVALELSGNPNARANRNSEHIGFRHELA